MLDSRRNPLHEFLTRLQLALEQKRALRPPCLAEERPGNVSAVLLNVQQHRKAPLHRSDAQIGGANRIRNSVEHRAREVELTPV